MKVKASKPDAESKKLLEQWGLSVAPYEWTSEGELIKRARFSPNSTAHLKNYLTHYFITIPVNLDGKKTTGKIETEKQLERLKAVIGTTKVSDLTETERTAFEPRVVKENLAVYQTNARLAVDFIESVFAFRKYNKAKSTYVKGEGWTPGTDGRIHTTFTLSATATWQLSSLRPNVQNLTKGKDANDKIGTELGKALRQTLWAEPGHAIMEFDYSGCHILTMAELAGDANYYRLGCVDAHSFLTSHMVRGTVERAPGNLQLYHKGTSDEFDAWIVEIKSHLADIDSWPQLSDNELKAKLGWIKSRFKSLRDSQAKPCIAEDQLVLTHLGLVPIQAITLDHLVWDGVDWVAHSGLIYKGIKETIEYDGLRATPDHNIFTTDGRKIRFQRAASEMARLEVTGNGGQEIRTTKNHFRRDTAERREGQHLPSMLLCSVQPRNMDREMVANSPDCGRLQNLQQTLFKACKDTWTTLRCYCSSVLQSKRPGLSSLRWAWNNLQLQVPSTVCTVGGRESTTCGLSWCGNRSNQQQWGLRTGKSSISDTPREPNEHPKEFVDAVSRRENPNRQLQESLREITHATLSALRQIWRGNNSLSNDSRRAQGERLEDYSKTTRSVRVYDIANAGPRHRFTVNGKLVANCILGNQLGLGARKLFFLNDKSFNSIDEARELQGMLRSLFPTIPVYQAAVTTQAHRDGYLISRHGATRYFTNVKQYNPGTGQWSDGPSAKEVIAFYVQNGAFGIIREAMLKMEARGLMDKYEFINSVHDSLVFHPRIEDIQECYWNITQIMEQPSEHIVSPAFPDGLRLKVEASIGPTWRDIVEVGHKGEEIMWPEWAKKQLEGLNGTT